MIKLFKYLKGSAIVCAILAPLAMFLEVAMDLLQPTLLSKIIDTGVANGNLNYVLYIGIQMVIASIVGLIAGSVCSYLAAVANGVEDMVWTRDDTNRPNYSIFYRVR